MKKFFAFLLAALMIVSLVGCGQELDESTGESTTAESTTDKPEEKATLLINGKDISEYKIVYSVNEKAAIYAKYPALVTEDPEYDKQTAERLAQEIKTAYGIDIPVLLASDVKISGEANMLVVGCVGDSLTYGSIPGSYRSDVSTEDRQSIVPYPAVLQRLEWKNMVVYNYGHGGRT